MCMCGRPIINGQPGYSWDGKGTSIRPVSPPPLEERDILLFDEPGRCGGLDAHSHHYRVTMQSRIWYLLVRHGGGDERIRLSITATLSDAMIHMNSDTRYWFLHAIYHAASESAHDARTLESARWRKAAAEKRIKVRKIRGKPIAKVTIEPGVS